MRKKIPQGKESGRESERERIPNICISGKSHKKRPSAYPSALLAGLQFRVTFATKLEGGAATCEACGRGGVSSA